MSRFSFERDCVVFVSDRFPPNCSAGMTEEEESAGRRQERETELLTTELLTGNKTEFGCTEIENTCVWKKIIDSSVDTSFFIGCFGVDGYYHKKVINNILTSFINLKN